MEITRDHRNLSVDWESADPAERILATARRLFYAQGFPTTGINQIIAESAASKKSFYRYFPAKDDLGSAYLEAEKEDFITLFGKLQRKYPEYAAFVRAWCFILKKETSCGRYHGCPFGNFASQTGGAGDFRPLLQDVIQAWREILERQLRQGRPAFPEETILRNVDRILMLYEGAVQLWKITGEAAYFDRLEEELLAIGRLE